MKLKTSVKIMCIAFFMSPMAVSANVKIHKDKFSLSQAASGEHFWARIYDWKVWAQTSEQKKINLSANFVKKAFDENHKRFENELSEDQVIDLLGGDEGEALYDFYSNRDEVNPEDIRTVSGAATSIKVAVDLPADFDVEGLSLDKIYKLIAKGDAPHIHTEVSKDFAHAFIDPLHAAHKDVSNLKNGKVILSTLNMGDDYYNCSRLNEPLTLKGELEGISDFDGNFRVYILNTVKELAVDAGLVKNTLVEGKPLRVFEQKVVYSSTLLKSGVNYLAFYELPNGKKKMVLNSVLVSTNQIAHAPGIYMNGVSIKNAIFGAEVKMNKGVALLSSKNVDLKPLSGACSKGLAQGVGRYVFGLAKAIAE